MRTRIMARMTIMGLALCMGNWISSSAQSFTTIASLTEANGNSAEASLVQGADGNFYGTTSAGGAHNQGTVFKVTTEGTVTTLYSFCAQAKCADGAQPYSGLVIGANGNFYGTTLVGGTKCVIDGQNNTCGTIFEINAAGQLTTLYNFCEKERDGVCTDGANPYTLVRGANGNFYGTTETGGNSAADIRCNCGGWGTIFEITAAGALTALHSFCNQWTGRDCVDGAFPFGAVAWDTKGNLYGTTWTGGTYGNGGTVYKLTPAGQFTTLYNFCGRACFEGSFPIAGLVTGPNENLYGVTASGGYQFHGTVFEITAKGVFETVHRFGEGEASYPSSPLLLASDGNLYGAGLGGGAYSYGALFKVTASGEATTLYSFCGEYPCLDGKQPIGGLVQGADGDMYGVTFAGGLNNDGAVYRLSIN